MSFVGLALAAAACGAIQRAVGVGYSLVLLPVAIAMLPDGQAVLAACRALAWTQTGRWLSKGEAARWADDPIATAALAARADPSAAGPTPEEVASILGRVGRQLNA